MRNAYRLAVAGLVGAGMAVQVWAGGACCPGATNPAACSVSSKECPMKGDAKAGGACCAVSGKGCPMMKGEAKAEGYGVVDTAALKAMVNSKVPATIVDARTAPYDDGKRIPGAIYLPADSSEEAITKALPDKEQLVVAYCSNLKCPASKLLAEKLVKQGYKNVVKYPEGLEGWIQAGQPVTETAKPQ